MLRYRFRAASWNIVVQEMKIGVKIHIRPQGIHNILFKILMHWLTYSFIHQSSNLLISKFNFQILSE